MGPYPSTTVLRAGGLAALLLVLPLFAGDDGTRGALAGQGVEDLLPTLDRRNAELWVHPLAEGIGFATTAGLFDGAAARGPLRFDVAIRVFGAVVPTEDRTFDIFLPDSLVIGFLGNRTFRDPYRPKGEATSPTVAGSGTGATLEPAGEFRSELQSAGLDPSDFEYQLPDGRDLSLVPYAVGQLSVGVGLGTELQLRFLPRLSVDGDVGQVRTLGWGVKHALSQWVEFPLDLAVQLGSQSVEVGDVMEATTREFGLLAGKSFGPLSLFGSAGARTGSVEFRYLVSNPDENPFLPQDGTAVTFQSDLDSSLSLGAGFRLQLLLLNLAGQYLTGDYDSFSVKVGMGVP